MSRPPLPPPVFYFHLHSSSTSPVFLTVGYMALVSSFLLASYTHEMDKACCCQVSGLGPCIPQKGILITICSFCLHHTDQRMLCKQAFEQVFLVSRLLAVSYAVLLPFWWYIMNTCAFVASIPRKEHSPVKYASSRQCHSNYLWKKSLRHSNVQE